MAPELQIQTVDHNNCSTVYILDAVSLISRNETGNGKETKKINEDRNKSEKTESQGQ